jgi:hypothetical protein
MLAGKEDRPFGTQQLGISGRAVQRAAGAAAEVGPTGPTPSDQGVSPQETVTGRVSSRDRPG